MLPAVLAWNSSVQPALDRDIAAALGQPDLSASEALYHLLADLDLPCSLPAVGVAETEFAEIARRASHHPVVRRNPRPIDSPVQVEQILQLAWQGQAA
jgi:maleylacetate reductase